MTHEIESKRIPAIGPVARAVAWCTWASLAAVLAAMPSCSSSVSTGTSSDAGGGNHDVCSPPQGNSGDGSSACGSATCAPGTYCFDSAVSDCENGCTASSNCATGQYCDLSNPTQDGMLRSVGTCRTPPSCSSSPPPMQDAAVAACPDIHGVYAMSLDTAGSSAACTNFFMGSTSCTVVQSTCALTWSCTPQNGFQTSTVDATGTSTFTVAAPGGAGSATCTVVFSSDGSLTWDCQFAGGGTAIDCKGTGATQ